MKDGFALIEKLRGIDLATWVGLFSALLGNFALHAIIATGFDSLHIEIEPKYYILSLALSTVLISFVFTYFRWIRPFDPSVVAVGFVIRTTPKSQQLYNELMKSLYREIDKLDLNDVVKIKKLPSDLYLKDKRKAETYIEGKGLRAVVWGDTSEGMDGSGDATLFNIMVSFQHQVARGPGRQFLQDRLSRAILRTNWQVSHLNSMSGIVAVGNNLLEVSLYTLGVTLATSQDVSHVERAVVIMESLQKKLDARNQDPSFPNLGDVIEDMHQLRVMSYSNLSLYYALEKKDFERAHEFALKWFNLDKRNYNANVMLARLSWQLGDRPAALDYTSRASGIAPKESLHRLNLAFFHFWDGKYGKALHQYQLINTNVLKANIIDVVTFIHQEYESSGKLALLFAEGWLSFRFGDHTLGKDLLEEFNTLAQNESQYKVLIQASQKLLKSS